MDNEEYERQVAELKARRERISEEYAEAHRELIALRSLQRRVKRLQDEYEQVSGELARLYTTRLSGRGEAD